MKYIYSIIIFLIAMPVFAQTVGGREFNLGFGKFSEILYPSYMNNDSELREIHRIINNEKNNILAGVSHIALVSEIRLGDKDNAAGINRASITGSVVRAFLKVRYGFSDNHFTFCFDDSRDTEHNVRVAIINRAISPGKNRNIYYTKNSDSYNYVMTQYGTIPMCRDDAQRYAVAEPVKDAPVIAVDSSANVIISVVGDSSTVAEAVEIKPKFVTELPPEKKAEDVKTSRKQNRAARTNDEYHPLLAVKTNGLYWAGYTSFSYAEFFDMKSVPTEFGNMLPNLEAEYYFNGRFSIAAEAAYKVKNYSNDYWWKVSSYSIEPRLWLGKRGLFRGAYIGLFGVVGDYDMKDECDVDNYGYTGMHYSGGLSFGYLQPIYKGLAIEIGVKGGYQYVERETYVVNSGVYYLRGSDTIDGFRILGAKISLMYRFKRK